MDEKKGYEESQTRSAPVALPPGPLPSLRVSVLAGVLPENLEQALRTLRALPPVSMRVSIRGPASQVVSIVNDLAKRVITDSAVVSIRGDKPAL